MNYLELFPTILGETIISDISLNEVERYKIYLNNLEYEDNGTGKYRGTFNQQVLDEPIFSKLKAKILKYAKEYLKTQGIILEDIRIVNSWGTKTNIDERSLKHMHVNSYISGVYYLEESSNINFYNPLENKWMFNIIKEFKEDNSYTHTYKFYTPTTNSLVIFPSYLPHEIETSKKDSRKSISFNIIPIGSIGKNTAILEIK